MQYGEYMKKNITILGFILATQIAATQEQSASQRTALFGAYSTAAVVSCYATRDFGLSVHDVFIKELRPDFKEFCRAHQECLSASKNYQKLLNTKESLFEVMRYYQRHYHQTGDLQDNKFRNLENCAFHLLDQCKESRGNMGSCKNILQRASTNFYTSLSRAAAFGMTTLGCAYGVYYCGKRAYEQIKKRT